MDMSAGVIGVGKLGLALVKSFHKHGIFSFAVSGSQKKSDELKQTLGKDFRIFNHINDIDIFPQLLFITVPDLKLKNIADEIAFLFPNKLKNTIVVHCSGFLGIDVFHSLAKFVKSAASLHPYQTFYHAHDNVFDNVGWMADCDTKIKPLLSELITKMNGAITFADEITEFNRDQYHLSAVFASNYPASSLRFATRCAELSGINPEIFIPKISRTTLQNTFIDYKTNKEVFALTGPIARGDIEAVSRHLFALRDNITELKGYVLIGLATCELAYTEKNLTTGQYESLKKLFLSEINELYSI